MIKEYLGITDIFTSILSKVEPTAFEKIFEKTTTTTKISNQDHLSDHLRTLGELKHPRGTQAIPALQSEEKGRKKKLIDLSA